MSRATWLRRSFLRAADPGADGSLSNRLRAARFQVVRGLLDDALASTDGTVRVLDVGGTADYWMKRGLADDERLDITLLNIAYFDFDGSHPRLHAVVGDGRAIPFPDGAFDVVVSNSTLEHVGRSGEQGRMVRELRRVGRRCYVQVPCRWFPIEPHTGFPFFAVLPFGAKVWLIRHVDIGHAGKEDDLAAASGRANDAHLLTARQTARLFDGAAIRVERERVAGLTKSVAVIVQ